MIKDIPLALSYDDVLLVPQYSTIKSRADVDISSYISPHVKINLPVISVNMTDVTGVEMAISLAKLGGIGFLPRFISPEEEADMVRKVKSKNVPVGAAIGCREGYLDRAIMCVQAGADILTLDIAHGHMKQALDVTRKLKQTFGHKVDIVSGVIATYEGASDLFEAGADSVRVGVGPGTICTTRTQTGVGIPQITAVIEASRAAKKYNKIVICDGGTKTSGDIVKGLAAGASGVIVGSQLAGHDESPGKLFIKKGKKYKAYNASTSLTEKKNHVKLLDYIGKHYIKHIEGVESYVPYKGPLKNTVDRLNANIRAGFSYCGAGNIKELWEKAKFIQITTSGLRESDAHDVVLKK